MSIFTQLNINFLKYLGNGGEYRHSIGFNIGPKPEFKPDLKSVEYNVLKNKEKPYENYVKNIKKIKNNPRTERVLKSMTTPYFKRRYYV